MSLIMPVPRGGWACRDLWKVPPASGIHDPDSEMGMGEGPEGGLILEMKGRSRVLLDPLFCKWRFTDGFFFFFFLLL